VGRITVVGGSARGRAIQDVHRPGTRVATARVRASLFDMLAPRLEGARVLDLFAGIGALGLEALSRGADFCVFVERDPACVRVIRANVDALGFADRARVVKMDAHEVSEGGPYGIVLLDPPYEYLEDSRRRARLGDLLGKLLPRGIIDRASLVVLKHGRGQSFETLEGLTRTEVRRYGETELSVYHV
jgi:16S rRNA (guanine966-N2)-methyltransferase